MLKRLFWSAIISGAILVFLIPITDFYLANVETVRDASNRNFVVSVIIFSILVFNTVFTVINTKFSLDPDNKSFMLWHKKEYKIPTKYYKDPNNTDSQISELSDDDNDDMSSESGE